MSDFQDQDKRNSKGGSNNNLFWIYGLIIAFVVIATFIYREPTPAEHSPTSVFNQLCENGMVEKAVISKSTKTIEVNLTAAGVDFMKKMYPKVHNPKAYTKTPHIIVEMGDVGQTENYLREKHIAYDIPREMDYSGLLQFILPLVILVVLWIDIYAQNGRRRRTNFQYWQKQSLSL